MEIPEAPRPAVLSHNTGHKEAGPGHRNPLMKQTTITPVARFKGYPTSCPTLATTQHSIPWCKTIALVSAIVLNNNLINIF